MFISKVNAEINTNRCLLTGIEMGKRNRVNNNQIYANALPIILSTDTVWEVTSDISGIIQMSWIYFAYQYLSIQAENSTSIAYQTIQGRL